jgi:hypothetical protein
MSNKGKLKLALTNVYGEPLGEKIDVILTHQVLTDHRIAKGVNAAKNKIVIEDLHANPQGRYLLEIDPPSFLAVRRFVNIKSSGFTEVEIVFPVDPKKVKSVDFPSFNELSDEGKRLLNNSNSVLSFPNKSGEGLYDALDDIRKAGLLNIIAKCGSTPLSNGKTVLPSVVKLNEVRGDRFFAVVPKELREETKHSEINGLFKDADSSLHRPPDGFTSAGSFKSKDRYGNLQLTFFMNGDDCVADIDIDDAAGLEHVFQVIRNALPGNSTHPYTIHEILVQHQKLDPGYRFVL